MPILGVLDIVRWKGRYSVEGNTHLPIGWSRNYSAVAVPQRGGSPPRLHQGYLQDVRSSLLGFALGASLNAASAAVVSQNSTLAEKSIPVNGSWLLHALCSSCRTSLLAQRTAVTALQHTEHKDDRSEHQQVYQFPNQHATISIRNPYSGSQHLYWVTDTR